MPTDQSKRPQSDDRIKVTARTLEIFRVAKESGLTLADAAYAVDFGRWPADTERAIRRAEKRALAANQVLDVPPSV